MEREINLLADSDLDAVVGGRMNISPHGTPHGTVVGSRGKTGEIIFDAGAGAEVGGIIGGVIGGPPGAVIGAVIGGIVGGAFGWL